MKIKGKLFILAITVAVSLLAFRCDYVDLPDELIEYECIPVYDSTMNFQKRVLIEDFTGHACGNCPRAHEKGEQIANLYCGDIVVISLHSGFFADASGAIHGANYTADYNTPFSNTIDDYYGANNAGFPKGLIDRREYNGNALTEYADWGGYVAQRLAEEPLMGIFISSAYSSANHQADIEVDVTYTASSTDNDFLCVLIVEDSVMSYQKDYELTPQDIPDYQHRHLVRGAVTADVWGDQISSQTISAGQDFTLSYPAFDLDPSWDASHCYVVAFVMNGTTKEVWNVNQTPLIPK